MFLVVLLSLLQFTVVLDFVILSPLGDQLIKALHITPAQFGWLVSSYAFSAGISGILTAGFADRFDRKKLLLFFYGGFIVGTFFCGISPNFIFLLISRTFTGFFGGVIASISFTIVTDLFALDQRGRVMGFMQMGFAVSQILGIPIGLHLANIWGWNSIFLVIVALAVIIFFLILKFVQPINKHLMHKQVQNAFGHLKGIIANKHYRIAFLMTCFIALAGFMLMPFSSVFLVNNVQISHEQLPMVFMYTGMATIFAMPIIGRISDKVSKFKVFTIGSLLAIVMALIYTNLPVIPMGLVILVNIILFISTSARMVPSSALLTAVPELKDRGAFMSVNASLQQVSGGIAAIIAGLIVVQDSPTAPLRHYDTLGYIVAALFAFCIYLLYRIYAFVKSKGDVKGKVGKETL